MLPFVTAAQTAIQTRKVKLQVAPILIAAISLIRLTPKTNQAKQKNQTTQPSPSPHLSNTRSFNAAHVGTEPSSSAAAHRQPSALRLE
jgi:hypothetical protein